MMKKDFVILAFFLAINKSKSQKQRQIGGSFQTGGPIGGSSQSGGQMLAPPPKYLSVPGFNLCLRLYTPTGHSYSALCLPSKKPHFCDQRSWDRLQNVFRADGGKSCPAGGKLKMQNH